MNMTPRHRNRLSIAAAVTLVVLAVLTAPVFVDEGLAAGLGVLALSAIAPLAVLGLIAYVWSGRDREAVEPNESRPVQH